MPMKRIKLTENTDGEMNKAKNLKIVKRSDTEIIELTSCETQISVCKNNNATPTHINNTHIDLSKNQTNVSRCQDEGTIKQV